MLKNYKDDQQIEKYHWRIDFYKTTFEVMEDHTTHSGREDFTVKPVTVSHKLPKNINIPYWPYHIENGVAECCTNACGYCYQTVRRLRKCNPNSCCYPCTKWSVFGHTHCEGCGGKEGYEINTKVEIRDSGKTGIVKAVNVNNAKGYYEVESNGNTGYFYAKNLRVSPKPCESCNDGPLYYTGLNKGFSHRMLKALTGKEPLLICDKYDSDRSTLLNSGLTFTNLYKHWKKGFPMTVGINDEEYEHHHEYAIVDISKTSRTIANLMFVPCMILIYRQLKKYVDSGRMLTFQNMTA